jgi:hypothetical protein
MSYLLVLTQGSCSEPRSRWIVRSPIAEPRIGPGTPTESAASNTHGPEGRPLHAVHPHKDALGRLRVITSGYRLCGGRGVVRSLGPRVEYRRYGLPNMDVYTSDLKTVEYGQARRVLETAFIGFRDVSGGSKEP